MVPVSSTACGTKERESVLTPACRTEPVAGRSAAQSPLEMLWTIPLRINLIVQGAGTPVMSRADSWCRPCKQFWALLLTFMNRERTG